MKEAKSLKTETVKISAIKPYDKNAKKHPKKQVDAVAKSIEKYGFVQPLVIDKDNVIVIGHCRFLAAKKLKLSDVPCVRVEDLTPEQVAELRLIDNKTNESEWDFAMLTEEMKALDLADFADLEWDIVHDIDELALDDVYEQIDEIAASKEPKQIQCPHCGMWFTPEK